MQLYQPPRAAFFLGQDNQRKHGKKEVIPAPCILGSLLSIRQHFKNKKQSEILQTHVEKK